MTNTLAYFDLPTVMMKIVFITPKPSIIAMKTFFGHNALTNENTLAYFDLPSAMLKTVFIIPRQSKEMTNTLAYFDILKDENSFYNTNTKY
jgi:hypothetical protein